MTDHPLIDRDIIDDLCDKFGTTQIKTIDDSTLISGSTLYVLLRSTKPWLTVQINTADPKAMEWAKNYLDKKSRHGETEMKDVEP